MAPVLAQPPNLALPPSFSSSSTNSRSLITPGRLIEFSAPPQGPSACTSTTVALLHQAQQQGETTAWIQWVGGPLYPPDLQSNGIDLDALLVVHIPTAEGSSGLAKAAEILLRSGAFGLVVIGLASKVPRTAWLRRLLGLARQHHSCVLLLTDKSSHADSLGPQVSIRIEPRRHSDHNEGFKVEHHLLKNKSGAPSLPQIDRFLGPLGL